MGSIVLLGTQWGDEGKGKITDTIIDQVDPSAVVRFNGGSNSGHTLCIGDEKIVTHNLPSGIAREGMLNILGPYTLCDPRSVQNELKVVEQYGSRLMIDSGCQVIGTHHKSLDALAEEKAGKGSIGTTKSGIGPCYRDFWGRFGLKVKDLLDADAIRRTLRSRGYYDDIRTLLGTHKISLPELSLAVSQFHYFGSMLSPYVGDTRAAIAQLLFEDNIILFEGGQGVLLDAIHGSWPYCTSSFCTPGAISASFGVYGFDRVVGIAKAYCTRVGAGPFPTELNGEYAVWLQAKGGEVGATTGRPRRCGWLDLPLLRYAVRVGGVTELVLTKIDVLSGLNEFVAAYKHVNNRGEEVSSFASYDADLLERVTPQYMRFDGWSEDISQCTTFEALPKAAREYIEFIERFVGVPVTAISNGPERSQMIWR